MYILYKGIYYIGICILEVCACMYIKPGALHCGCVTERQ